MTNKMHNNLDTNSIGGAIFSTTTFLLSYIELDQFAKLGLMTVSAAVGITTIVYNIQKIKKLKDNEER